MEIILTSRSLKQIKESGLEEDFELEILDEKIYTNLFVALFISRTILKEYLTDRTIRRFKVEFPHRSIFYSTPEKLRNMISRSHFYEQFKLFLEGTPIHIPTKSESKTESNLNQNQNPKPKSNPNMKNNEHEHEHNTSISKYENKFSDIEKILIELSKILDNDEMIDTIIEQQELLKIDENTSIKETVENLIILRSLGYSKDTIELKQHYEHISKHFYELFEEPTDNDEIYSILRNMKYSDLEQIITSEKLQIKSEDELFEIIEKLGGEFINLIDYIETKFLSVSNIAKLIEYIDNNSYKSEYSIHQLLWESICRRLIIDNSKELFERKERNPRETSNSNTKTKSTTNDKTIECREGIIKYLEETSKSNVYKTKMIDVETSYVNNGEIKNIFDHSKDSRLQVYNNNSPNPFIILDFKDKRINISKYYFSVPSSEGGWSGRPKTWNIEGSNDKENWYIIDERANDTSFKEYYKSNSFSIQQETNNFYRFIRIKGIEAHNGSSYLLLSEIEFYGRILNSQ